MNFRLLFLLLLCFTACRQSSPTDKTSSGSTDGENILLSPDERFGDLFVAAQAAEIFPDSKTFPDCIPNLSTEALMEKYQAESSRPDFDIHQFVKSNFQLPVTPGTNFKSDTSRSISQHIDTLWSILTREIKEPNRSSLLPLPNPHVVPGGRFSEVYYWDSYFIMLGLEAADRVDLIENMVGNFAFLIDEYGFIPNGTRTYYLSRSQPPFFAMMVKLLADQKGDDVYKKYLPQLVKEYQFWMEGLSGLSASNPTYKRLVRMDDGAVLNRYWDNTPKPRPESYREDVALAKEIDRPAVELYRDIRSACESGWDFSSRWFKDGQYLASIQTTNIIPVDLNSLMYHLESVLSKAYQVENNEEEANLYSQRAEQRFSAIQRYCWDDQQQYFCDYNHVDRKTSPYLSLAGVFPLYFGISQQSQADAVAKIINKDFLKPGGLISTLEATGQQWDAPNGWAPLQWMTIQGLRNYGANDLANTIKIRWVALNDRVYKATGKMVEKYNVMDMGLEAGGGEYPVQDGFGWSNGVILKLLMEDGLSD